MRVIKFRGWHATENRMFSAEEMAEDQLTIMTTGSFINVHGSQTNLSTIYDRDKFIPMQFTGLTDKNGLEIYEADLLQVAGNVVYEVCFLLQDEYEETICSFGLRNTETGKSFAIDHYAITNGSVIGNTHQP